MRRAPYATVSAAMLGAHLPFTVRNKKAHPSGILWEDDGQIVDLHTAMR